MINNNVIKWFKVFLSLSFTHSKRSSLIQINAFRIWKLKAGTLFALSVEFSGPPYHKHSRAEKLSLCFRKRSEMIMRTSFPCFSEDIKPHLEVQRCVCVCSPCWYDDGVPLAPSHHVPHRLFGQHEEAREEEGAGSHEGQHGPGWVSCGGLQVLNDELREEDQDQGGEELPPVRGGAGSTDTWKHSTHVLS